jgi:ferrous iron transport protein B
MPGVEIPEAIVVVADACSLERSLLLVGQVLRREKPTCLVLSMYDELKARGGELDLPRLEDALGVPVVPVVGHRGVGLEALRSLLEAPERWSRPTLAPPEAPEERAAWAASILDHVQVKRPRAHDLTERIDRVVLSPVVGPLLFAAVMITFFQLIFAWASPAMDAIDALVGAAASGVHQNLPAGLITDFLADGLIAGVGSVVIFVPQITLLFGLLYLLEDVGYMARAAFVVDRAMGRIGLEGRAFVALLSSYACAVPGIMATRTIPSPRDRLVTMLVAPLITCSARLPVYALLIGAFVPARRLFGFIGLQGLVLFGLYFVAPVVAMLAAAVLKRTIARSDAMPFVMELPTYRAPTLKLWISQVWRSVSAFLKRAGTIILLASMLLWVLLTFPRTEPPAGLDEAETAAYALEHSAAGRLGHAIEPAIAPLGFDWKIGVGLVASLAAREVIVATLAQIYAASDEEGSLRSAVRSDVDPRTGRLVFTPATVGSLLVFFVFALQCTSTLAILARETNSWRWPIFAFTYLLVLAYGASFVTYRVISALQA